ncbi:uncharacterized protein LOC62_03G005140 [Vanrija pseudolonga]|uniref:Mitochondrial adapter protein MCP1 transmembrane domain-containing protein n=1 Tax=Vanrija pseudolonga TaxID=143232 RepID=A0AAF0Y935_9TREE|nr:hypothetical protein LOC62_03G005140 [Vanrija pseudolonga]
MSTPDGRAAPAPAPASGTLLRVLTHTQNASAAVFGVFLTVHLAAPIAAAVGGLAGADGAMLIGREYYLPLEPIAVFAPLGLHVAASIARRALIAAKTGPRKLSTQQYLGYALLPLVLPHLLLHRLIPADAAPPVSALSPSEFGFEFVANAVATRPWMTVGYLALTGAGLFHAFVGGMKVVGWAKRLLGKGKKGADGEVAGAGAAPRKVGSRRRIGLRGIVATLVGVVGIGLWRLGDESAGISTTVLRRYDAVYAAAPWAGLGLK